jgi:acyl-CoA synthetase (NDP forming)
MAVEMGFPVAAKLSSIDIQHKTDIGAVRLNVPDVASIRDAFDAILSTARRVAPNAQVDGALIQPMIPGGVETMMGIVQDPLFGPLVAFGLGGIHVEILKDVIVRIAPLTDEDVDTLLHGIKGFPLLEGYRGHPAADLAALRDLLLRLSRLADAVPEIAELDLNPVIALAPGQGCRIVDARITVRRVIR